MSMLVAVRRPRHGVWRHRHGDLSQFTATASLAVYSLTSRVGVWRGSKLCPTLAVVALSIGTGTVNQSTAAVQVCALSIRLVTLVSRTARLRPALPALWWAVSESPARGPSTHCTRSWSQSRLRRAAGTVATHDSRTSPPWQQRQHAGGARHVHGTAPLVLVQCSSARASAG